MEGQSVSLIMDHSHSFCKLLSVGLKKQADNLPAPCPPGRIWKRVVRGLGGGLLTLCLWRASHMCHKPTVQYLISSTVQIIIVLVSEIDFSFLHLIISLTKSVIFSLSCFVLIYFIFLFLICI